MFLEVLNDSLPEDGGSKFLGNQFTKLHDFISQKPVICTQISLPRMYVSYFHLAVAYIFSAGSITVLCIPVQAVCSAENELHLLIHIKSVEKAEGNASL